jgi:glycosyltransferase involved in cell wall biosynthesis
LEFYDIQQAPRFGRVTFVNEEDSHEFKRIVHGARTDWVPHGIDAEIYCPDEGVARQKGMIVITGNMFHVPNVDGVEFFCRDVFPLVCERVPSASLWLVGAKPGPRVTKWAKHPRIRVTGDVPDIRPYLHRAIVSVCPVRLRIGTQTKILEALACATPVVTTSAGNYGIGASSGEHLYVADDRVEFANRVIELLEGERWHAISQNGRGFVENNFTWAKSALKLEQIVEQLTATSSKSVPSESYIDETHCGNEL